MNPIPINPMPMNPPADPLRPLALLAAGRSGADIERLVREARARARRQHRPVTWSDIKAALLSSERETNAVLVGYRHP
ncbi:MAG: hypothetical protein KL863_28635 [Rhizobium sp.]|nr:hypothetical protein [Rhizobium sp.]